MSSPKTLVIRTSPGTHARLKVMAAEGGVSMQLYIERILAKHAGKAPLPAPGLRDAQALLASVEQQERSAPHHEYGDDLHREDDDDTPAPSTTKRGTHKPYVPSQSTDPKERMRHAMEYFDAEDEE